MERPPSKAPGAKRKAFIEAERRPLTGEGAELLGLLSVEGGGLYDLCERSERGMPGGSTRSVRD